jgi:hypothetical protein
VDRRSEAAIRAPILPRHHSRAKAASDSAPGCHWLQPVLPLPAACRPNANPRDANTSTRRPPDRPPPPTAPSHTSRRPPPLPVSHSPCLPAWITSVPTPDSVKPANALGLYSTTRRRNLSGSRHSHPSCRRVVVVNPPVAIRAIRGKKNLASLASLAVQPL